MLGILLVVGVGMIGGMQAAGWTLLILVALAMLD
jgi:hypothetical protein